MFENIKKEDKIIFGSIALIVIFLLSTIVTYGSSFGPGPTSGLAGNSNETDETYNKDITGPAKTNCTLASWDPMLVVVGNSSGLDSLVQELKESGAVVNEIVTSDGRLVRLSSHKDVFTNAYKFSRLGLSAYSDAVIDVASMSVGGKPIAGNNFKTRMEVNFEEGDVFACSMNAVAKNGQLTALSNFQIAPSAPVQLFISPKSAELNFTFYRFLVPWESRNINAKQLEVNMRGGTMVFYKPRSYVVFYPELTSQQVTSLTPSMPSYVQSLQADVASISPEMTDRAKVEADLKALGLSPIFQESQLDVWPYRGPGESEDFIYSDLLSKFSSTFPGVPQNVSSQYRLNLVLPDMVEAAEGTYIVANNTLAINSQYPPSEGGILMAQFYPVGKQVKAFTFVQYVPKPELKPLLPSTDSQEEPSAVPALNGTSGPSPNASEGEPLPNSIPGFTVTKE